MINSVIFDFWSTLCVYDTNLGVKEMKNKRIDMITKKINSYGYNFNYDEVKNKIEEVLSNCEVIRESKNIEFSANDVIKFLLKEMGIDDKYTKEVAKIYSMAVLTIEIYPRNGANEVLSYLQKNNYKIGIISNTEHGNIEINLLKRFGLYKYFNSFVFSCNVRIRKPHKEIFAYALKLLNAEPSNSVYVGDLPNIDILGAKNAGMKAIYLNLGKEYPKDLIMPDYEIKELTELPSVLVSL